EGLSERWIAKAVGSSTDLNLDGYDVTDHITASIRIALEWLRAAALVGGAGEQLVFADLGFVPVIIPAAPAKGQRLVQQAVRGPKCAAVGAEFYLCYVTLTGPSGGGACMGPVR